MSLYYSLLYTLAHNYTQSELMWFYNEINTRALVLLCIESVALWTLAVVSSIVVDARVGAAIGVKQALIQI